MSCSISARVGFIALVGVTVRNSDEMVSAIKRLWAHGQSLGRAVQDAAEGRLRPALHEAVERTEAREADAPTCLLEPRSVERMNGGESR